MDAFVARRKYLLQIQQHYEQRLEGGRQSESGWASRGSRRQRGGGDDDDGGNAPEEATAVAAAASASEFAAVWQRTNPFVWEYRGDLKTLHGEAVARNANSISNSKSAAAVDGFIGGVASPVHNAVEVSNAKERQSSSSEQRRIQTDLGSVRRQALKALPGFWDYLKNDADQFGVRLLVEFMVDLIGRNSIQAKLFRELTKRALGDSIQLREIDLWLKVAVILFLLAGNVLIVYSSLVMLQDQTRDRLRYWIGTVAVMVAVDMFIVEPLEVFWFHWIQPYCAVDAISAMRTTMQNILQRFYGEHNHEYGTKPLDLFTPSQAIIGQSWRGSTAVPAIPFGQDFSMPNFQFVSTNVANTFPKHIVSQVLISYRTDFPFTITSCRWPTRCTVPERLNCGRRAFWSSGLGFESIGYMFIAQPIMLIALYVPPIVQQLMLASLLSFVGWLLSLLVYFTIDNIIIGCIVVFVVILCIVGVRLLFIPPQPQDPNIPTFMPLRVAPPDTVADRARSVMQRVQLEEDDESDDDFLSMSERFAARRAAESVLETASATRSIKLGELPFGGSRESLGSFGDNDDDGDDDDKIDEVGPISTYLPSHRHDNHRGVGRSKVVLNLEMEADEPQGQVPLSASLKQVVSPGFNRPSPQQHPKPNPRTNLATSIAPALGVHPSPPGLQWRPAGLALQLDQRPSVADADGAGGGSGLDAGANTSASGGDTGTPRTQRGQALRRNFRLDGNVDYDASIDNSRNPIISPSTVLNLARSAMRHGGGIGGGVGGGLAGNNARNAATTTTSDSRNELENDVRGRNSSDDDDDDDDDDDELFSYIGLSEVRTRAGKGPRGSALVFEGQQRREVWGAAPGRSPRSGKASFASTAAAAASESAGAGLDTAHSASTDATNIGDVIRLESFSGSYRGGASGGTYGSYRAAEPVRQEDSVTTVQYGRHARRMQQHQQQQRW